MPITLVPALRNIRADAIATYAGNAALLRLYTAAYATLLAELPCGTPFAGAASGGVLTLNPITDDVGLANGNAALARIYRSDGTTVVLEGLSVTITGGGGDIILNALTTGIATGQPVSITSGMLTEGNL
jgi:hypothetical protein